MKDDKLHTVQMKQYLYKDLFASPEFRELVDLLSVPDSYGQASANLVRGTCSPQKESSIKIEYDF